MHVQVAEAGQPALRVREVLAGVQAQKFQCHTCGKYFQSNYYLISSDSTSGSKVNLKSHSTKACHMNTFDYAEDGGFDIDFDGF